MVNYRVNICKCCAPLKINFFAWLVTHDKILSRKNLVKKWWIGSTTCGFCGCSLESTEHIFLHYLIAVDVWGFFFYTLARTNDIHIDEIFSLFLYAKFNLNLLCWNMLVLAIVWCIWLNRNSIIFRNQFKNLSSLLF